MSSLKARAARRAWQMLGEGDNQNREFRKRLAKVTNTAFRNIARAAIGAEVIEELFIAIRYQDARGYLEGTGKDLEKVLREFADEEAKRGVGDEVAREQARRDAAEALLLHMVRLHRAQSEMDAHHGGDE